MSWEDYEVLTSRNRRSGQRLSKEIKDRVRKLYKQGRTYAQINARLGVSSVTIRNIIKEVENENK